MSTTFIFDFRMLVKREKFPCIFEWRSSGNTFKKENALDCVMAEHSKIVLLEKEMD